MIVRYYAQMYFSDFSSNITHVKKSSFFSFACMDVFIKIVDDELDVLAHQVLASLFERFMAFVRAVVKRAKYLVPGDFQVSIITFKIAMVHLVVETPQIQPRLILYHQAFKARMRRGCC